MPRSRNIKHSFFANDELAEHDPLSRLLFIGLWTIADYKGDLEWRPKRIKAQLLPYDECDLDKIAINLDLSGFVRTYSFSGQMYLNITNFIKHQNPHKNERDKGSDIPGFTEDARQAIDFKGVEINRDLSGSDRDKNDSDPADSCSLIPDSGNLIPEISPLSSKPDGEAKRLIEYLNHVTGKNFRVVESNIKFLRARFKEGHSAKDVASVIDRQNLCWPPGHHQREYMRPATLFNAEKFNQYVGELGQPVPEESSETNQSANKKLSAVDRVAAVNRQRAKDREAATLGQQDGNIFDERGNLMVKDDDAIRQ